MPRSLQSRERMRALFSQAERLAKAPQTWEADWYEYRADPTPKQRACRVVDTMHADFALLNLGQKTSLMFLVEAQINAALAARK